MLKIQAYLNLCVCLSCFKLLFLKSYVSTDFDVHRNWMAITYNLPIREWYFDATYEGTLDYPPLFAVIEYVLATVVSFLDLDKQTLKLTNQPIRSELAIIYQKLTVIFSDLVYYYAIYKLCQSIEDLIYKPKSKLEKARESSIQSTQTTQVNKDTTDKSKSTTDVPKQQVEINKESISKTSRKQDLVEALYKPDTSSCIALLLLVQPGLLLVDHVHFQYNGFLNGVLILSITNIIQGKYLFGSFWFSTLLNLKHIYLYCAPAYGMYLLASHCLGTEKNVSRLLSFVKRVSQLALVVILVFIITYTPFANLETLKQIVSRLFPFKRGLTHAYWAPNAWSLYNLADKVASIIFKDSLVVKFDLESISKTRKVSSTSGLVEEYDHQYLPSIKPITTFAIVGILTIPIIIKYLLNTSRVSPRLFIKGVVLTAFSSFMFGWHVHEKAILTVLLPLIPISCIEPNLWPTFLRLTLAGTYSLFPLLFERNEYLTKICLLVVYYCYARSQTPYREHTSIGTNQETNKQQTRLVMRLLKRLYPIVDRAYLMSLILCEIYFSFFFGRFEYSWNPMTKLNKLTFLPLMATSNLSALGILMSYLEIYYDFLFAKY